MRSWICPTDWFEYCFQESCRGRGVWREEKSIRSKSWNQRWALLWLFLLSAHFCSRLDGTLTLTLFLRCVQGRGSAFPRLRGCCRRCTATGWRLSAAALMERVSPCSRSCWSAACCCSYEAERAKRSSSERWVNEPVLKSEMSQYKTHKFRNICVQNKTWLFYQWLSVSRWAAGTNSWSPLKWLQTLHLNVQQASLQPVFIITITSNWFCVCVSAPRGLQSPVRSEAGVRGRSGRVFVPLQSAGESRNLRSEESQRGSSH